MNIREEILSVVDNTGSICEAPFLEGKTKEIQNLIKEGILVSIASLGIKFINEDYLYVRSGNPDNVAVVEKYGRLILEKTKK